MSEDEDGRGDKSGETGIGGRSGLGEDDIEVVSEFSGGDCCVALPSFFCASRRCCSSCSISDSRIASITISYRIN